MTFAVGWLKMMRCRWCDVGSEACGRQVCPLWLLVMDLLDKR